MKNSFYKIFFTIEFDFKIVKNKRFSKYFKSDLDLDNTNFNKNINAINILAMWENMLLKLKFLIYLLIIAFLIIKFRIRDLLPIG